MTTHFSERADQLTEQLRAIEHATQDSDELFYCAYIMGLLGLHSSVEGDACVTFDQYFYDELQATISAENLTDQDKNAVNLLWEKVTNTPSAD
ncbi:YfcL family protein [Marinomonas balearica]|uniref:YfcL protein n=1 Tax=Marinomonas balearica TaxID=491947 RepID=A0A4R6M474_9GAMM|nr:YfcL family protein [Marinomonas balearica]TDO96004.1 YfcL protein [Marinomonas balearica]